MAGKQRSVRPLNVRCSEKMYQQIAAAADENQRSMSQEVRARVEKSFEHEAIVHLLQIIYDEIRAQEPSHG